MPGKSLAGFAAEEKLETTRDQTKRLNLYYYVSCPYPTFIPMPPDIELARLNQDRRPRSPVEMHEIFAHPHSYDDNTLSGIRNPWKRDLFALLELPTSSASAFIVHCLMTTLIVLSAVVTVLETVPAVHSIPTSVWFGVETSLVALFTIEYILRCYAWSDTWKSLFKWVISFFGIIDLLSVLPYYIEILLQQDTSVLFRFSILRMFRLLRVFRPFRYNNTILLTIEVMYLSVRRSQHALLAISFFVIMVLTVFSTLLYFAERGTWDSNLETFINSDGDPSQFASIPAAAWFVIVTITTVGYGEITPRSFLGRLVTLPLLVFGLLLIALPSFVLGREFSLVWERMSKRTLVNGAEEPDSPTALYHQHTATRPPIPTLITPIPPLSSRDNAPSLSKLAQNQSDLSRQIADLKGVVEAQGMMLRQLLSALEERTAGSSNSRHRKGKTRDS